MTRLNLGIAVDRAALGLYQKNAAAVLMAVCRFDTAFAKAHGPDIPFCGAIHEDTR